MWVTQKCEELDNLKRYNNKLDFSDAILVKKKPNIFHNEHCCWMFGKLATALIKTCIRENIQRHSDFRNLFKAMTFSNDVLLYFIKRALQQLTLTL